MYFKRCKIILFSFLVFIFVFIACKSSDSEKKPSMESYGGIFILSVEKSIFGTEVVCGCESSLTGAVDLKGLVSKHECLGRGANGTEKSGVFIAKTKFDAVEDFRKYLLETVNVVEVEDFKLLKAQFDEVQLEESTGHHDTIGENKEICEIMNSDVHIVAVKDIPSSYNENPTSSVWEEYIGPASKEVAWRDSIRGNFWTMGKDLNQKNFNDALNYCKNLTYAGMSGWTVPNEEQMSDMYKRYNGKSKWEKGQLVNEYDVDNVIPKFFTGDVHGSTWWISQKVENGNVLKAMQYSKESDELEIVKSKMSDKLYVICFK